MKTFKATIRGTRALLMHNGQLKDPMNKAAKTIKSLAKRKDKSDESHMETARAEFEGSLYYDDKLGPYLPVDNLQAMVIEGATKRKLGTLFKAVVEVVQPTDTDGYALKYTGPRTPEEMWQRSEFVFRKDAKVGQSSVMRTRPIFRSGWSCTFEIEILDDGVEGDQVRQAIEDAGKLCGIGDWTPRYGRFVVDNFAELQ